MVLDEGMYDKIEQYLFNILNYRKDLVEIASVKKRPKKKEKEAKKKIQSYFKKSKIPLHEISNNNDAYLKKELKREGTEFTSIISGESLKLILNISSSDDGDSFSIQDTEMCLGKFFALFYYLKPPEEEDKKQELEDILSDFEEYIVHEDDIYKLREKTYLVLFRVGDEPKYAYRISTNGTIAIEVEEIGTGYTKPETLFPVKEYKHIAKSFKENKDELEAKRVSIEIAI